MEGADNWAALSFPWNLRRLYQLAGKEQSAALQHGQELAVCPAAVDSLAPGAVLIRSCPLFPVFDALVGYSAELWLHAAFGAGPGLFHRLSAGDAGHYLPFLQRHNHLQHELGHYCGAAQPANPQSLQHGAGCRAEPAGCRNAAQLLCGIVFRGIFLLC